jgi:probable HAF family extracellular repeat protein
MGERTRAAAVAVATAVAALTALPGAGAGAVPAAPQARVTVVPGGPAIRVTELRSLGRYARVYDISERGRAVGESAAPGGPPHAVLWDGAEPTDLTPEVTGDLYGPSAQANAVNDDGMVLGTLLGGFASVQADTFVWEDGARTTLPPAGTLTTPFDLNGRGQVLYGTANTQAPGGARGLVWQDGTITEAPPVGPDGARLLGLDISERGLVAGAPGTLAPEPYTWRPGQAPTALALPAGADGAAPGAVNERGDVVGQAVFSDGGFRTEAVRWRDGRPQLLGTLGGRSSGTVPTTIVGGSALNRWGDVAGTSDVGDGTHHAYFWHDGRMTDLGTLGGANSRAAAVNDWGQVVGVSDTASGEQHAFLWQNGRMVDLTALAGGGSAATVTDVNDRGQVVGYANRPGAGTVSHRWDVPVLWGLLP